MELAAGSTVGEQLTELAGWEAGVVGYLIHFEHFVDVRPGDEILVLRNGAWDSGDPNTYDRYIGAVPLPDETFNYDLTVAAHRVTPDV